MLYRIDLEHFLTHAIDYFTRVELTSMQYLIVSSGITTQGRSSTNVVKYNSLYPIGLQDMYHKYGNKELLRKPYFESLDGSKKLIYNIIVRNILNHSDIVILCREVENEYIDLLTEYIKEEFSIECIDLNELFKHGRIGPIYIDRDEIHNKTLKVKKEALRERQEDLEATSSGRSALLSEMSRSEKIKKLKSLGIHVTDRDMKSLDNLLIEGWVEDDY